MGGTVAEAAGSVGGTVAGDIRHPVSKRADEAAIQNNNKRIRKAVFFICLYAC